MERARGSSPLALALSSKKNNESTARSSRAPIIVNRTPASAQKRESNPDQTLGKRGYNGRNRTPARKIHFVNLIRC